MKETTRERDKPILVLLRQKKEPKEVATILRISVNIVYDAAARDRERRKERRYPSPGRRAADREF